MDPQEFGFLDPDPDPRAKILTKTGKKKFFTSKTIKISSFLNGSSSFRLDLDTDPDPHQN